jgi:hypothetical protein
MLNVVTQAYRDIPFEDILTSGTLEARRQRVFATYFDQMIERRKAKAGYTSQQTRHWFIWLAQKMEQHHLTEFYLEHLQPTWLTTKRAHIVYAVLKGLFFGLVFGLASALVAGLVFGLILGLVCGLLVGLVVGLASKGFQDDIQPLEVLTWSWKRF